MDQTYNEQTFRYFLGAERKRAQRARRSFLLLLVTVKTERDQDRRMSPALATAIFSGLRRGVREVDFIGWFREERIAAAVLTQGANSLTRDTFATITQRMRETLSGVLPFHGADGFRLRVVELRPSQQS
jgi:hypothetical protein